MDLASVRLIFRIVVNNLRHKLVKGAHGMPVEVPSLEGMAPYITPIVRQLSDAVSAKVQASAQYISSF